MSRHTKRAITSIFSAFLVLTGIAELWRVLVKRPGSGKVTILVYHRVLDLDDDHFPYYEKNVSCSPTMFERQMVYLKKRCNILSLEQYVYARQSGSSLPPSSVIVTFDDGYRDIYTNAYPILRKHNVPAVLFVTTNFIEGRKLYWWDAIAKDIKETAVTSVDLQEVGTFELGTSTWRKKAIEEIADKLTLMDEEKRKRVIDELIQKLKVKKHDEDISTAYVTWEHLCEMSKNNVEIGAHTLSHPNLTQLDDKTLSQELRECKQQIEHELNTSVTSFAYPYGHEGHFDPRVICALKEAGFMCACTTIYGSANRKDDLYQLKRIPIFYYNNMNVFKAKLSGVFDDFEKLVYWKERSS